jgi:hypothetical protein
LIFQYQLAARESAQSSTNIVISQRLSEILRFLSTNGPTSSTDLVALSRRNLAAVGLHWLPRSVASLRLRAGASGRSRTKIERTARSPAPNFLENFQSVVLTAAL